MVDRARSKTTGPTGGGGTVIITPAGDSDGTISTGTQTETMMLHTETSLEMGNETDSMEIDTQPLIPLGSQTESFDDSEAAAVADSDLGSQTESALNDLSIDSDVNPMGSDTDSFSADALAAISDFTNTASVVTANTPTWTSSANAQGDFDGTEASHSGFGDVTDLDGFDSTLRCDGFAIPSTPSGFTQTDVIIRIRHRWDLDITLAVAGVTDVTQDIDLLDSSNTLIANLSTRLASGGGGTQSTLIDEDFVITSIASPAQLAAGVKIDCHFFTTGVPTGTVNGNTSWNVDGVHMVTTFNRTGIT